VLAFVLLVLAGWRAALAAFALWGAFTLAHVVQLRRALAPRTRCARGHPVDQYGCYRCTCGATAEGWVWRPCRFCGASAGWTNCPRCGLSVPNPLLEDLDG
jgi:hypothetical protein